MMIKNLAIVILVPIISVLCSGAGCSPAAEKADCVNERTRSAVIRWGDYDTKGGRLRAYQFNGALELSKVKRETMSEQPDVEKYATIEGQQFCKWFRKSLDVFEQIQSLNAPGEISRYVEYSTPKTTIRAVWNPKFQTFGSKEFRMLYDSLMTLVPETEKW